MMKLWITLCAIAAVILGSMPATALEIEEGTKTSSAPLEVPISPATPAPYTIALDRTTVKRGYTVTAPDRTFMIGVVPEASASPLKISIDTTRAEESFVPPTGWDQVSATYKYDLQGYGAVALAKNITLSLTPTAGSSGSASLFFYDRTQGQWRMLPTVARQGAGAITTATRLPFAHIAAFTRKTSGLKTFTLDAPVPAAAVMVVDEYDKVLYAQNAYQPRAVASITKLMTALVFLDHNPGWDKTVTFAAADDAIPAKLEVKTGDQVSVKDVFYAMLIGSNNNCAKALARVTGLSAAQFVAEMNAKAKKLGMGNSRFVDVTGLHADNRASVQDASILAWEAFKNQDIHDAASQERYKVTVLNAKKTLTVVTTDKLLGVSPYVVGGKTGFINESGYNFIAHASHAGREIVVLVFGAADTNARFTLADMLIKKTFGPANTVALR